MYNPFIAFWQIITFIITTLAIVMISIHYYGLISIMTLLKFIGLSYFIWFVATTPFCVAGMCFGILYLLLLQVIFRNS